MRVKQIITALFIFLISISAFAQNTTEGEPFTFKYKKDDNYRILSTVEEDVLVNGQMNHHARILNRISVHVTDVNEDGSGIHKAYFMASEESKGVSGNHFSWGDEYESEYTRDKRGFFDISDEYFMPVVRNLPIFPEHALTQGETWSEEGYEVEDLRRTFNIDTPYKVPFTARYRYDGRATDATGKVLHKITATYNIRYNSPAKEKIRQYNDYPMTTMGRSTQTLYFDAEKGALDHYSEVFRITIETIHGTKYEFRGTADAKITSFERTSDENTLLDVQKKVDDMGIENVNVTTTEKGLTISIEKIKFMADSAVLQKSEQQKLMLLSQILKEYPNNDILVTGYTAAVGSVESRIKLSQERAESVAQFLMNIGVRKQNQIFTQGLGSENPVAPSDTEENKSRNRRVEITILDR